MRPLCFKWEEKVRAAYEAKKEFQSVADQCMGFFSGGANYMWSRKYMRDYMGGSDLHTRFPISINKAFEMVALFGPTLYWRNPHRMINPRKQLQLPMEAFAALGDQMAMMVFQQAQQQAPLLKAQSDVRAMMMEMWLNYTPGEMPGGGLASHASSAITEALVKGRGVTWPKPYMHAGSTKVMTGCFYDSVDNLLIDPDATSLTDAKWIAQRVRQPIWEAERIHQLPPGTLKHYLQQQQWENRGQTGFGEDPMKGIPNVDGNSFDMIEYYRIFSKAGIGARLAGMNDSRADALDQKVGDYAYVVVARGIPFPLNAHPERYRIGEQNGDSHNLFRWPIPAWRDGGWPCCVLDFYPDIDSPWPIAPLAPGLGELCYINILLASLAEHIYSASKMYLAGRADMIEKFEDALRFGQDWQPIKVNASGGSRSIRDIIDFLQPPNLQTDVWRILEALMAQFEKATGLNELMYGNNPGGKQIRTAEDAALRGDLIGRRPEHMASKVEDWMTMNASMEMKVTRQFIEPQDIDGLMGQPEQFLWQRLINEQDPDRIYRDLEAVVMANSTRRPDKTREVANINQTLQTMLPLLQGFAQMSGDFGPLNNYIRMWGDAIDMDVSGLQLNPPPPQPPQPDPGMQIENEQARRAQEVQMQHLQQAHEQKLQHSEQQFQQKMNQQQQQAAMKAILPMLQGQQMMSPVGVM